MEENEVDNTLKTTVFVLITFVWFNILYFTKYLKVVHSNEIDDDEILYIFEN